MEMDDAYICFLKSSTIFDLFTKIFHDNNILTVKMLLTLGETDFLKMGLKLPLVRTILQNAKDIVGC